MTDILKKLQDMQEDGPIWKALTLWRPVASPDEQVDATEQIADMLIKISNEIKRSSYAQRIVDAITADLAGIAAKKKDVADALHRKSKELAKLRNKKQSEENDKLIAELEAALQELEQERHRLDKSTQPKLDRNDIVKLLKEKREKIERDRKQAAAKKLEENANVDAEALGLHSDFDGEISDVLRFGVYANRGRYYSKRGEANWEEISNFTMKIIYHVETGGETAYRLIAIKNVYGIEKIVNINTDDFVSVGSFKKVLARRGDYVFSGNDSDLTRLSEYLQKDEKSTQMIDVLGYNTRGKFFAFANGLVNTSGEGEPGFKQVDEYGIVEHGDKHFFIPAMSKMFAEKDDLFKNEKLFVYTENHKIDFRLWSQLHRKSYGDKAVIAQMWYLSALFRDVIYNIHSIKSTPILNMFGPRGAGKSAFAGSLTCMYGYAQPEIGLGSVSTPKGFLRTLAQFKNSIVWLEEYKNNIHRNFIEALKNVYDGIGYTRAVKSTDFQTESIPVNSACLLSGQEMPTAEDALFSRVIMLTFEPGKNREAEQVAAFKRLKDQEALGLSSITCEILRHRALLASRFAEEYERTLERLFKEVNNRSMDDRFIKNIAILATTRKVLEDVLDFAYSQEEAEQILIDNLRVQFAVMEGNDDVGKWWQIVESLLVQGIIRAGMHFKFDGPNLVIKTQDVYPLYLKEMNQRRDAQALARPSLEQYLRGDKEAFVENKKFRFGQNTMWAYSFNYTVLQERYRIELSRSAEYGQTPESATFTENQQGETPFQDWNSAEQMHF